LDTWSVKTRSPELKSAIVDLLSVIAVLKGSRESVIKAFDALTQSIPKVDQAPTAVVFKEVLKCKDEATNTGAPGALVGRETKDAATNTTSPRAVPEKAQEQGTQQQRQKQKKQPHEQQQRKQKAQTGKELQVSKVQKRLQQQKQPQQLQKKNQRPVQPEMQHQHRQQMQQEPQQQP